MISDRVVLLRENPGVFGFDALCATPRHARQTPGRRARVELPPCDLDLGSGRARLSYRRAAECFEQATTGLPGGPFTLHQLRHSALTHAAEDGANTATLLALSGHTSVASLAKYTRVSPQALARWQQARDPAARRR